MADGSSYGRTRGKGRGGVKVWEDNMRESNRFGNYPARNDYYGRQGYEGNYDDDYNDGYRNGNYGDNYYSGQKGLLDPAPAPWGKAQYQESVYGSNRRRPLLASPQHYDSNNTPSSVFSSVNQFITMAPKERQLAMEIIQTVIDTSDGPSSGQFGSGIQKGNKGSYRGNPKSSPSDTMDMVLDIATSNNNKPSKSDVHYPNTPWISTVKTAGKKGTIKKKKKWESSPVDTSFKCHMCDITFYSSEPEYLNHLKTEGHRVVAEVFHAKNETVIVHLRACAKLDSTRKINFPKKTNARFPVKPPLFCDLCQCTVPRNTKGYTHEKSLEHELIKGFLKVRCCDRVLGMKKGGTRIDIDNHMLTINHLRFQRLSKEKQQLEEYGQDVTEDDLEDEEELTKLFDNVQLKDNYNKVYNKKRNDSDDEDNLKSSYVLKLDELRDDDVNRLKQAEFLEYLKATEENGDNLTLQNVKPFDGTSIIGTTCLKRHTKWLCRACHYIQLPFTRSALVKHGRTQQHYDGVIRYLKFKQNMRSLGSCRRSRRRVALTSKSKYTEQINVTGDAASDPKTTQGDDSYDDSYTGSSEDEEEDENEDDHIS